MIRLRQQRMTAPPVLAAQIGRTLEEMGSLRRFVASVVFTGAAPTLRADTPPFTLPGFPRPHQQPGPELPRCYRQPGHPDDEYPHFQNGPSGHEAPSVFQTGPAPGRAPVLPEDWHGPVNTLGPEPAP